MASQKLCKTSHQSFEYSPNGPSWQNPDYVLTQNGILGLYVPKGGLYQFCYASRVWGSHQLTLTMHANFRIQLCWLWYFTGMQSSAWIDTLLVSSDRLISHGPLCMNIHISGENIWKDAHGYFLLFFQSSQRSSTPTGVEEVLILHPQRESFLNSEMQSEAQQPIHLCWNASKWSRTHALGLPWM